MTLEDAISMEPVKEKLRNLRVHLPQDVESTYQFGEFLADRLNPDLVPKGFLLAAQLALCDLSTGVDGYTGEPIIGGLTGQPPGLYRLLEMRIPDIARTVCPVDFAEGVKRAYDQFREKAAKTT